MDSRWREALRWLCLVVAPMAMWPLAASLHPETLPAIVTVDRAEFAALLAVTTVATIAIAAGMVGLFTASLWFRRRNEAYHGWFALTALSLGLLHAHVLVAEPPLPLSPWMSLFYAVTAWCVLFAALGLADLGGGCPPRLRRAALAYGGLASAALVALGLLGLPRLQQVAAAAWIAPAALFAYAIQRLMAAIRARPSGELYMIQIAASAAAACGLHDWLMLVGLVSAADGFLLPYSVPAVLAAMTWVLLHRFVGALARSEALVAELERRVAAKRRELERADERVRDVDRRRIIAEERERVMREMHDGLGAHLVSTLALLEQPGASDSVVSEALCRALEEMRLMADSLEPVDGDLPSALGRLRAHVQPRLEAAGIGVDWRVEDVPAVPGLGPHGVLQLLRILQEAITNVLKHSGARRVRVRTGIDTAAAAPFVYVELADDGHGGEGTARRGRGLVNMRRRAEQIGAQLEIESTARGTAVRLRIPTSGPAGTS